MRADDIGAGLALCRASHWNQIARDWELFLALAPDGCLVAVDEGDRAVGSVAAVRYGRGLSWVAMVLVDPAHRGRGLGTRLLHEALGLVSDEQTVGLDATPAGHGLYVRAGFREIDRLQRMERPASAPRPVIDPERAGQIRRMTPDDLSQVLALDADVSGADRARLIEWLASGAPEYAWVCGETGVQGFLLGRHGHSWDHLGPLVARDEAMARALVAVCLDANPTRAFLLDAPVHASWIAWLEAHGFVMQRPFIRMVRGATPAGDRTRLFAITGAEFS